MPKYSYLADGTKHTAFNTSGAGVLYLGSLVYRRHLGNYALESASFDAGRFVAAATSSGTIYRPYYFVTDHLGSVRAVVDAGGEVLERNDYYPFGLRWSNSAALISDNRYRYNGKEEQAFVDVPYIDYGARMYDPAYRMSWFALDPLAEKYLSVSPYAFCSNNPIKYIDLDGCLLGDPIKDPNIVMNRASNLFGSNIRVASDGTLRNHQGFDYYAPEGTPVYSVKDGIVVQSGENGNAYGISVTIEHTNEQNETMYSFYGHLSKTEVKVGDNVKEGSQIALSGITGNAQNKKGKDQHLHFELRTIKESRKGLEGKRNPNEIVDTKFESQDPTRVPQSSVGIIKIRKDQTKEFLNIKWN